MKVIVAYPPNFERICSALPTARKPGVVFSYGDLIYNPAGVEISKPIMAHEAAHSQRQGGTSATIEEWWEQYISDPMFRMEEELIGHRAQWRAFQSWHLDRNERARELHVIASALSGPLYQAPISYQMARRMLQVSVDPRRVAKLRAAA